MPDLKRLGLVLAAVLILAAVSCSPASVASVTLNISAAASLTNALNEIDQIYTGLHPNVTIVPNFGGSGTLETQIENGAPCDVFISAASAQMDALAAKNLLLGGTRKNLLTNHLALIVPKNSTLGITSFTDLASPRVKLIAIGDPSFVPAGAYAEQTFAEFGIADAVESKLILGASVSQVLQYVDGGDVDAGVVYSTDALSDARVVMVAIGPTDIDAAIVYPVAVIKSSQNSSAARDYVNFLFGEQAKTIFQKYGFSMAVQ
jgi:molybdate transport system substrate-binding protein